MPQSRINTSNNQELNRGTRIAKLWFFILKNPNIVQASVLLTPSVFPCWHFKQRYTFCICVNVPKQTILLDKYYSEIGKTLVPLACFVNSRQNHTAILSKINEYITMHLGFLYFFGMLHSGDIQNLFPLADVSSQFLPSVTSAPFIFLLSLLLVISSLFNRGVSFFTFWNL